MSPTLCRKEAREAGLTFAAVQAVNWCLGTNDNSTFTTPGTCNLPCQDGSSFPEVNCGGTCAKAIYTSGACLGVLSKELLASH